MTYKEYNFLHDDAVSIRKKVFMEEEGFENEFDSEDESAIQVVAYDSNYPIATCRIIRGEEKSYIIGRVAVIKEYRGKNIGGELLCHAEKVISDNGGKSILLHSQCRVVGFYKKFGFIEFGNIDDDEGCLHIWMKKELM